uniref:Uncharacterized protein n=1 Tax=Arundo donax TaxID=35708 RepID=A0A0A9HIJ1_ARUDO
MSSAMAKVVYYMYSWKKSLEKFISFITVANLNLTHANIGNFQTEGAR